jgi:hypothetical protein
MSFEVPARHRDDTRVLSRSRRLLRCLAVGCISGVAVAGGGCGPTPRAPDDQATATAPVINGSDDRKELYELAPAARESIAASVAVLMWAHRIDYSAIAAPRALTLAESARVCDDERFADQPAAAVCSATLIDDDLVLTAGHCLGESLDEASARCARLLVVFDYFMMAPGELFPLTDESVYACRRVAFHDRTSTSDDFRDIAVIELDRVVDASRKPATIAGDPPEAGSSLVAASSGAALPLKIDGGGSVVEVPEGAGFFVASTDSFAGGSGAPLFNEAHELVGHQVRGLVDWRRDGDCLRPAVAEEANEQHQHIGVSIAALCDSGWPSERLCARASRCGDPVCRAGESERGCPEDCAPSACGDALCELDERDTCVEDCARYRAVPASWQYDPAEFPVPPAERPRHERDSGCSLRHPATQGETWLAFIALALFVAAHRRRSVASGARSEGTRRGEHVLAPVFSSSNCRT